MDFYTKLDRSVVLDLEWYRPIKKFNPKATTEHQQDREN